MTTSSDEILTLDHQIRELEHALHRIRNKKIWSNVALAFGPLLGLILYTLWWIQKVPRSVLWPVYYVGIPVALAFCIASFYLKTWPGIVRRVSGLREWEYVRPGKIELDLALVRDNRKRILADNELPTKIRRITYKDDAYAEINRMRAESGRYRTVNNTLQGILIIGSLAATGASGLTVEMPYLRWVTLGLTFMVGIASGFMGYFKYKERSFYLQQTADAIEGEWEAVEILVGRYKRCADEAEALAEFVEEVHRLKSEQKKRQQNLEQPPDAPKTE
jgi:MFS family permease